MAVHYPHSASPQPSLLHAHVLNPSTPIHSPHPSLSSTSSRTPLHALSLHEYRKQQNTPSSHSDTPPGKALRRKAAASALNELERVPSVSKTPQSTLRPPFRALHFSHSTQHLSSYHPLPPSPPLQQQQHAFDQEPSRSQSAEPLSSVGRRGGLSSTTDPEHFYRAFDAQSPQKVSNWKPIKRLPRPLQAPASINPHVFRPPHVRSSSSVASVISAPKRLSQNQQCSSTGNTRSTGEQATPSTVSLSRFPQPPHLVDLSPSPPNEENEVPLLNLGFTTTAPVTPPATPAVVHYRGTSFDVVNPHDSLLLHDIETPLRDSDSPEYFPTRSSTESLFESEMAPARPLFRDFNEAYRSIAKGTDDSSSAPPLAMPTPPRPVVVSPNSGKYSAGYDNELAVSPLAIRKNNDSRFSLFSNLKRKMTKRGARDADADVEQQELQDMPVSPVEDAIHHLEGDFPRSLIQSYRSAPQFTPDSSTIEHGRGASGRISMSAGDLAIAHYYDNESLYPASSIYTADGGPGYPASLADKRKTGTTDLYRYSVNPSEYRSDIASHQKYAFADSVRTSKHSSRPLVNENVRASGTNGVDRADTISKFVNLYEGPVDDTTLTSSNDDGQGENNRFTTSSGAYQDPSRPPMIHASSGLSKFEFNFEGSNQAGNTSESNTGQNNSFHGVQAPSHARKPTIGRTSGAPPHVPPPMPVRPSYESEEHCAPQSGIFSGTSSYSDTRQLLQLSQQMSSALARTPRKPRLTATPTIREALEPSSSYSQSEGKPAVENRGAQPSSSYSQPEGPATPSTPNDALEQAQQIFDDARRASTKEGLGGIPMIWTRQSSGNLKMRRKSLAASIVTNDDVSSQHDSMPCQARGETPDGNDEEDWETIDPSPRKDKRVSTLSNDDSIADCSDDENTPYYPTSSDYLDFRPAQPRDQRIVTSSSLYQHPRPLPQHDNPFSSSPPALRPGDRVNSFPSEGTPNPGSAGTRKSTTVPIFRTRLSYRNHQDHYKPVHNPFAQLSDKETQELLNSGPNEDILYEGVNAPLSSSSFGRSGSLEPQSSSSLPFQRENTFDKLTVLGPKANLTGTPNGTGMREVGSSLADTSDPGEMWSSQSPFRSLSRPFFTPESLRVTNPDLRRSPPTSEASPFTPERRTPSTITQFPSHYVIHQNCTPSPSSSVYAESIMSNDRYSRQFHSSPPSGRAAVAGMTKLRQMVLAPDNASVSSANSTRISHFMGRPQVPIASSMHTFSPLRSQPSSIALPGTLASEHSPHLLCVERELSKELEAEQKKMSKVILGCFFFLPPLLLLYAFGRADWIVAMWSKGKIGGCHPRQKQIAKWIGGPVNVMAIIVIVAPILAFHAAGTL